MPTTTPPRDNDRGATEATPGTPPETPGMLRQRTLEAAQRAWDDLARAAATPVDVSAPDGPVDLLTHTRIVAALDKRAKCMAVIALAVYGHDWREIAILLGMEAGVAQELYAEAVRRWVRGDREPWRPPGAGRAPEPESSEVVA